MLENPDLVSSDYKIAVISALWYFKNNVIETLVNGINSNTTVEKVSEIVNGGSHGLKDRKILFNSAKNHINCL